MPDEPRQSELFAPRVEQFFRSANSAVVDHLTGFGQHVETAFGRLRGSLKKAREGIALYERRAASRFSVFAYIEPDENRLSDILAGLLNPRGAHGQGERFLRLFAERSTVTLPVGICAAKVYREETTTYIANPLRRIDILIDADTFGIGIENKPWALEQDKQLADYHEHLNRRYAGNFLLVYLSGSESQPASIDPDLRLQLEKRNQFRFLNYRSDLAAWLSACIETCEADSVRWFLCHFREYVMATFHSANDAGGSSA